MAETTKPVLPLFAVSLHEMTPRRAGGPQVGAAIGGPQVGAAIGGPQVGAIGGPQVGAGIGAFLGVNTPRTYKYEERMAMEINRQKDIRASIK